MNVLKVLFPALMVLGAAGRLIVNLLTHGEGAVSLHWEGAMLLYTALLMRNMG